MYMEVYLTYMAYPVVNLTSKSVSRKMYRGFLTIFFGTCTPAVPRALGVMQHSFRHSSSRQWRGHSQSSVA